MKKFALTLVPILFKVLMHLVMHTCRIRWVGREHLALLQEQHQNWIYSAWHNNTAISIWIGRGDRMAMMASASRDGELIARAISAFGNLPVRGSSSTDGGKAAREMIRAVRSGHIGAVTPDGPRGPKYVLQPGVLTLSALSACPLVPVHFEATRQWEFKSWDRHKIPKPFSTVYVCIGEPFWVDQKSLHNDIRTISETFQKRMMANARHCLSLVGRTLTD